MKKIYILYVLSLLSIPYLQAQHAVGTWQSYLSYHHPTRSEVIGSRLYVVANKDLYSYDKEDTEIRTFYKSAPLSDTDIAFMAYAQTYKTLIIVYDNANIDLLVNEETVYNLPDYKNKSITQPKTVNQVCFHNEYAYLATASGILVINLKKIEISNYYMLDYEVSACNVADNQLYAATRNGLYAGSLESNLLDKNNWKKVQDDASQFIEQYKDVPFKSEVPEESLPDSPIRNYPYYLNFINERLLVAGGGHVANRLFRPGTVMIFENNTWNNFQETGISQQTGYAYQDINCVAQDPNDDTHHFAASAGEGIYEFRNGEFVNWYSMHNSPLESALPNELYAPNYVRVNGLIYDCEANLWMVSSEAQHAVTILKSDGTWVSLYYPEITQASNFGRTIFDRRGRLWATSSRIESGGLFCLDYANTLEDTTDDQHRFITRFTNQEGTLLEQLAIYCITEDKEGAIWIGTNKGPLVLHAPERFFDDNFYCTQIKVPRNDGSNLADFLLINESINALAVDGGNRKWIGTSNNGIYLLSADGQETIHHFTAENSPLPSNSIESIAIYPRTGQVFIGTTHGLVAYQSDATNAAESFKRADVRAYPNPVRPDYNGVITITGLVYDSDVKIIDTAGHLVYQGSSLGGQFTWNGCTPQGRRVATGIYMVLATDREGKEGVVTKIAFIR
ncbi:MAG: Por secretion system protein [Prevotellaceae bacterium]|jgi:hypothetical protein|nr:Por secretion system protein [Prevotellaceae bacterium]